MRVSWWKMLGIGCLVLWMSGLLQQVDLQAKTPKKPKGPAHLTIHIHSLRSNKGSVDMLLFNHHKGFPSKPNHAFSFARAKISRHRAVFRLRNLPYGTYAVSAFHDENGNRKLDTNWLGIPREGTAASNNAKGFMGPPKFRDARFSLQKKQLSIQIKMNY